MGKSNSAVIEYVNNLLLFCPQNLCPGGSGDPAGPLADAIKRDFGSFDAMKAQLSASTVAVQGSGWGWLGYNKGSDKLQITTCANQVCVVACTLYR